MEAKATKIDIGKTRIIDVTTNPLEQDKWGIWSDEKYIVVSYLVNVENWFSQPTEELPNAGTPYVSKVTSTPVTPMTWGGTGITSPTATPNESVEFIKKTNKLIIENKNNLISTEMVNIGQNGSNPTWMIIEDETEAKIFEDYIIWLSLATKTILQKENKLVWSPNPLNPSIGEMAHVLVMPNNKIISQYTFNLVQQEMINYAAGIGKEGMASKIIEIVLSKPIEITATTKLLPYGTIDGTEYKHSLFLKLNNGEQFPFQPMEIIRIPNWVANLITGNLKYEKTNIINYAPARIIEEFKTNLNPTRLNECISYFPVPTRIINFLKSLSIEYFSAVKVIKDGTKIISEDEATSINHEETLNYIKDGAKIVNKDVILNPTNYFPLKQNILILQELLVKNSKKRTAIIRLHSGVKIIKLIIYSILII